VGPTGFTSQENPTFKNISTLTGRLGYVVNNNWLIFGKGGWARTEFSGSGSTLNPAGILVTTVTTGDKINGWTIGAGVEWAFAANLVAKLEYDYANFGTTISSIASLTVPGGVAGTGLGSSPATIQMVKAGLAYRFNIGSGR
jgi:outer membrane immunogenic protein